MSLVQRGCTQAPRETRQETLPRAPVQGVTLRTGGHPLTHRDERNKTQTEKPRTAQGKQGEAGTDKLLTALWRGRRSVWGQTPQNRDKHSCVGPPAGSQQGRRAEAEQLSQCTGQLGQHSLSGEAGTHCVPLSNRQPSSRKPGQQLRGLGGHWPSTP